MKGKPRTGRQGVRCNCDGFKASGTFEIEDRFLVLDSEIGKARVLIGIQEPRRLATKLMRNVCLKFAKQNDKVAASPTKPAQIKPPISLDATA